MAKHVGRGIAAIEYPTGMNQNGDPSQCWIKVKPDGRIDVFAGTADIGNGSKTIQSQIVAETIGVPYDWITYDNSNTDSSPMCTGTFASRATFVAGKAAEKAALQVKQKLLDIAAKEMEIDAADLEIVDGEVIAKGAPQKKMSVADVAGAATFGHGELITGTGAQLKPYAAIIEPETGKVDLPPHSAISYAACAAEVEVDDETGEVRVLRLSQCYDVGRALNPSQVEGQIEGGAMMGLGLGVLENCYPYYPEVEHRGGAFGSYLAPAMEEMPQIDTILIENPSADGPYGAKGIGEMANNPQPPAIAAAVHDAIGVWITELPITPERVLRALEAKAQGKAEPSREGKKVVFDEELSVNAVSSGGTASCCCDHDKRTRLSLRWLLFVKDRSCQMSVRRRIFG
jgi:CO/xanthine dehydrogenase Mo-binding subunit